MPLTERRLTVDGLTTRVLDEGGGPVVLLLHGGGLGCSADDWRGVMTPLAAAGLRVLVFDQPGFGACDESADISLGFRGRYALGVLDALGIDRATWVGHSQGGRLAVAAALGTPARVAAAIVLCTGSLLPPVGAREREIALPVSEPTPAETRAVLEAYVYDRALVSADLVAQYQRFSEGRNFEAAVRRATEPAPLSAWDRLAEVAPPLMLVYGANDRGPVAERVALARERYPQLPIHLLEQCGHFAQWDQPAEVVRLIAGFARP